VGVVFVVCCVHCVWYVCGRGVCRVCVESVYVCVVCVCVWVSMCV